MDPGTPASGVLDLLTRLVDSSLVFVTEQGGAARYRRLETVRQYALEKLRASGESGDVQRRHAAYYLAHVKAVGQYDRESKQWIASELDNARAALRWSLESGEAELAAHLAEALAWFWYLHGYWHEGRNWHHQVSALLAGAPHTAVHEQIMFSEGHIAQYQGDVVTARVLMEQSVALCRQLGDREGMLRPLHDLARLAREAGDFARARELFGEVLALAGEVNALHSRGYAQIGLGLVAVIEEDVREATMWFTAALATAQDLDSPRGIAWALNDLAYVAQLEGHYARAAELHEQSLPLFAETDRQGVAWAHAGWGEAALAAGDTFAARFHFGESLRIFGELGDSAIIWSLAGLASVAVLHDDAELAARLWGAEEALRERTHRRPAPVARSSYERALGLARAGLGQAAFDAAWSAGRRLSLEQVVALAAEVIA